MSLLDVPFLDVSLGLTLIPTKEVPRRGTSP